MDRLVFSTETPNNQGFVVPYGVIDFSRYRNHPILLRNHDWDALPVGKMIDIDEVNYIATPYFHKIDEESVNAEKYYKEGLLQASIGGANVFRTTGKKILDNNPESKTYGQHIDELYRRPDGYLESALFILYEISLPSIASNPDCNSIKLYSEDEYITKLNSHNNNNQITTLMAKKDNEKVEDVVKDEAEKAESKGAEKATETTEQQTQKTKAVILGADKNILDEILGGIKTGFEKLTSYISSTEKAEEVPLHKEPGGGDPIVTEIENNIELEKDAILKAEQEQKEKDEAELAAKKKADEEAEELKAKQEAELKAEQEAECAKKMKAEEEAKLSASPKSPEQLKQENVKLHTHKTMEVNNYGGITFSKLKADFIKGDAEAEKIFATSLGANKNGQKDADIESFKKILTAMLQDPTIAQGRNGNESLLSMFRFHQLSNHAQVAGLRTGLSGSRKGRKVGTDFESIMKRLNAGIITGFDPNTMNVSTLGAGSDYVLNNPDLMAVAWSSMYLFKLFPSNRWEQDVPTFGVEETSKNVGVIFTNVNSTPTISMGSKPTVTTAEEWDDKAVSVILDNFWLAAQAWTPLEMHMLRTDKMATQWEQDMAAFKAYQSTILLWRLAAQAAAAGKIIKTTGSDVEIATSTDINYFPINPNYNTATLGSPAKFLAPTLNDLLRTEQMFSKQNFDLDNEPVTMVMDSVYKGNITRDDKAQNKLNEWKKIANGTIVGFGRTDFYERSIVAAYDSATGLVKDPTSVLPATTISANLSFMKNQVAIAQGMIDVFMVQNPKTFSYEMSADERRGITALRWDRAGVALNVYDTPQA